MAEGPAILVIGPRWVGDMVMAQCLFSALEEIHPGTAIDVLAPAWAVPLVDRMPEIRAGIVAPFSRGRLEFGARLRLGRALIGRYQAAYVMQGSWKSALVPFVARIPRRVGHLREFRYGLINDIVALPESLKRKTAEAFFSLAGGGTFRPPHLTVDGANQALQLSRHALEAGCFAAFMPGAEYGPAKRWPADRYAALARQFMSEGLQVALFGSGNDRPITQEIIALAPGTIDLAGKTRLEDTIDLIAAARVAVANDSGLMHIAAAVNTPVVAVYGSTAPANTPPLADARELVWLGLDCSPCHQRVCPLGHFNCMNTLDVELVAGAAKRLLASQVAP